MKKEVSTAVVLAAIEKKAKPTITKLQKLSVDSIDSYEQAAQQMKLLKTLLKEAEKEEAEMIDPIKLSIKKIQEHFKPFTTSIKALEEQVKAKMLSFVEAQEKKRALIMEKVERGDIKKMSTAIAKVAETEIKSASSQTRYIDKLVVDDFSKVPRQYLLLNESAICKALKQGTKVAGCRLEKKANIAI